MDLETLEEDRFGTVEENEWSSLIKARFKEGYVEGKYAGGESTVQSGFDRGYETGFETSFPVSVLKGLLAASEIMQKGSGPDSLLRSKEVKQLLNELEQKTMLLMRASDKVTEDERTEEGLDQDPKGSCDEVHKINKELCELKKEVLVFLKDSNHPQILEQITHYFEKWNHSLPKNTISCSDHSTSK